MRFFISLFINTVAVYVAARLIPGIEVDNLLTAFTVSIVLGILNASIKPLLLILTLPINVLTLGIFTFIINAAMVGLTAFLITGFSVSGLLAAILFSITVSIVSSFLNLIAL